MIEASTDPPVAPALQAAVDSVDIAVEHLRRSSACLSDQSSTSQGMNGTSGETSA